MTTLPDKPSLDGIEAALMQRWDAEGVYRFDRTATREQVFAVIDAAFAQRRKMLRSALAGLAGSSSAASRVLEAAGVDPQARGEVLDVVAYARIAEQLASLG